MKVILKLMKWFIGIFILILIAAPFFLASYLDFDKIKELILKEANTRMNREVKIGGIKGDLFSGVVLEQVEINRKDKTPEFLFEKINLNYSLMALLQKKVKIHGIEIENGFAKLEESSNGQWSFDDILIKQTADNSEQFLVAEVPANFQINVDSISFKGLKVLLKKKEYPDELSFEKLSGEIIPSDNLESAGVKVDFQETTLGIPLHFDGKVYIKEQKIEKGNLSTKIPEMEKCKMILDKAKIPLTPEIQGYISNILSLAGFDLQVEFSGTPDNIVAKISVPSISGEYQEKKLGKISTVLKGIVGTVSYKGNVNLQSVSLESGLIKSSLLPSDLTLNGNLNMVEKSLKSEFRCGKNQGEVSLDSSEKMTLKGDFYPSDFQKWIKGITFSEKSSVNVSLSGKLVNSLPLLKGTVSGSVNSIVFAIPPARGMEKIESLDFSVKVDDRKVSLVNFKVKGKSLISGKGEIDLSQDFMSIADFSLEGTAEQVHLEDYLTDVLKNGKNFKGEWTLSGKPSFEGVKGSIKLTNSQTEMVFPGKEKDFVLPLKNLLVEVRIANGKAEMNIPGTEVLGTQLSLKGSVDLNEKDLISNYNVKGKIEKISLGIMGSDAIMSGPDYNLSFNAVKGKTMLPIVDAELTSKESLAKIRGEESDFALPIKNLLVELKFANGKVEMNIPGTQVLGAQLSLKGSADLGEKDLISGYSFKGKIDNISLGSLGTEVLQSGPDFNLIFNAVKGKTLLPIVDAELNSKESLVKIHGEVSDFQVPIKNFSYPFHAEGMTITGKTNLFDIGSGKGQLNPLNIDIQLPKVILKTAGEIKGLKVEEILVMNTLAEKLISGNAELTGIEVDGNIMDLNELKVRVKLNASKGEVGFLKSISEGSKGVLPFKLPDLSKLVYDKIGGDIQINQGVLESKSLQLLSPIIQASADGKLNLKDLVANMNLNVRISKEQFEKSIRSVEKLKFLGALNSDKLWEIMGKSGIKMNPSDPWIELINGKIEGNLATVGLEKLLNNNLKNIVTNALKNELTDKLLGKAKGGLLGQVIGGSATSTETSSGTSGGIENLVKDKIQETLMKKLSGQEIPPAQPGTVTSQEIPPSQPEVVTGQTVQVQTPTTPVTETPVEQPKNIKEQLKDKLKQGILKKLPF